MHTWYDKIEHLVEMFWHYHNRVDRKDIYQVCSNVWLKTTDSGAVLRLLLLAPPAAYTLLL